MRSRLVVLTAAVTVAVIASASSARPLASTWSGTWNTDFGSRTVMTLAQSGSSVTGTYTWDDGQIQGTVSGGVLRGTWTETPTRAGPNDAGEIEFTLSADGKSFTGRWRYGSSGNSWRSWSGTCSAGACTGNTASGAEPVKIWTVANGCGGAGWASIVKVQNYLGNKSVYKNSNKNPAATSYTVNFKDACDLHDAGYTGVIVEDRLRGNLKDFRRWSRKQVDDKFLADMRLLCERQIPATATVALTNCKARGGNFSFGAVSRYNFVRRWGHLFFDADPDTAGLQSTGPRANG